MRLDTNEMRNEFFKISIAEGHHNTVYSVMQIALMILNCIRGKESFEEGAKAPSAQTLRDRLLLDSEWLAYFHDCMWRLAEQLVGLLRRVQWRISIDETHEAFFGDREKLNAQLVTQGLGRLVLGYCAKTPGATGSFGFLVVSLCCCRIKLPIAIWPVREGEPYEPWLEPLLRRLLHLVPGAIVLADRGFGHTSFFLMLERLGARYVVRLPVHSDSIKRKIGRNQRRFAYWMTCSKTGEKALLTIRAVYDSQGHRYVLATSEDRAILATLLAWYGQRWDIENIFKDSDRVLLPTSSRNPRMRLYCTVLSFFLSTLWKVGRLTRMLPKGISLRSFVKHIISALGDFLGCMVSAVGRILPRTA